MDGTMAGYYLAEGSNKDLFIIFLEGGGACYDKIGCDKRAKGPLGSSKQLAPTFDGGTHLLVNPDCSKNPSFCAATRVVVAYCTGDTHVGNNTSPSAASWGYYFDGHANLVHIVEQLVAGAPSTTSTGCSSGSAPVSPSRACLTRAGSLPRLSPTTCQPRRRRAIGPTSAPARTATPSLILRCRPSSPTRCGNRVACCHPQPAFRAVYVVVVCSRICSFKIATQQK